MEWITTTSTISLQTVWQGWLWPNMSEYVPWWLLDQREDHVWPNSVWINYYVINWVESNTTLSSSLATCLLCHTFAVCLSPLNSLQDNQFGVCQCVKGILNLFSPLIESQLEQFEWQLFAVKIAARTIECHWSNEPTWRLEVTMIQLSGSKIIYCPSTQ